MSLMASIELRIRLSRTCSICRTSTITGGSSAAGRKRAVTLARSRSGRHSSIVCLTIRSKESDVAIATIESYQRAQTPDHFCSAVDLGHRLLCGLRNFRSVGIPQAYRVRYQAHVDAGRHQWLINLMRHRRGQFTDAAEPCQTRERLPMQAQLELSTPSFGNQLSRESAQSAVRTSISA